MTSKRCKLALLVLAAVLSFDMLLFTGLIDGGVANWYSHESAYRRQTDSLCHGRLALSEDPRDLDWDMAWHDGKVQQVWGLGVPLIRLPFELAGRMVGNLYFPDRLTLCIAIFAVAFITLDTLLPRRKSPGDLFIHHPAAVSSAALLLLFPPFLSLCTTRFFAYEEAAAYSYLTGTLLLVLTLRVSRSPSWPGVLAIASVAGFAPLIRPTLLAYSLASLLVVGAHLRPAGRQWIAYGLAFVPFPLLMAGLMATNAARFGAPAEFGHAVNLNDIAPMRYVTRFESPFSREPFPSAAIELFSCLFLTNDVFNGFDWYQRKMFPGQSDTLRWREFYFTAFDISYLLLIASGWGAGLWWFARRREKSTLPQARVILTCLCWSAAAVIPVTMFYLRFPAVSTRYNLDFAPAFCAAIMSCLFAFESWTSNAASTNRLLARGVWGAWAVWLVGNIAGAETGYPTVPPITHAQAVATMTSYRPSKRVKLPGEYRIGMNVSTIPLAFNTDGWNLKTGATDAAVALWIDDPSCLEITLCPAFKGGDVDPSIVRAKIGLEHLRLHASHTVGQTTTLRFHGPTGEIYKRGLQVAYLGLVEPENVSESDSPFKLLSVSWRRSGTSGANTDKTPEL